VIEIASRPDNDGVGHPDTAGSMHVDRLERESIAPKAPGKKSIVDLSM
jgi:hypothetical protein